MEFRVRKNARFRKLLGDAKLDFLAYALGSIERILPHIETSRWKVAPAAEKGTRVTWLDSTRRSLKVVLGLNIHDTDSPSHFSVSGIIERRKTPAGVGSIARTIDARERAICEQVVARIGQVLRSGRPDDADTIEAVRQIFDECVIAAHLKKHHQVELDLREILSSLRDLAEQSYENKSLTFGCLIDANDTSVPLENAKFPSDFFQLKKFRFFSDGFRTAYKISAKGGLSGLRGLSRASTSPRAAFYPEWCEDLTRESQGSRLGVALTKQGDILILDGGNLRFTYRLGCWQYWNHSHLVDLLRNAARTQRVPPRSIPKVVRALYRSALDVSFRRSGGLFVLLRNAQNRRKIVRSGDAIDDSRRPTVEKSFDRSLPTRMVQALSRSIVAELAAVDGAVVLNNRGEILAYGAVLDPKKKGRITRTEGSRTKAAVGASNYGLAVKVSSDGDITIYLNGSKFIRV